MSKRGAIGAVATPDVAGVVVRRHLLDVEAERMMGLVTKVGKRLRHWLKVMPEERQAMRYDREAFAHHPVFDQDGNPVTEPLIPDKDWLETADWYQKTMLGLLKEQRERAKMADGKGALPIDDATFEQELRELARQAVREMPTEDLQKLLAERMIAIDVGGPSHEATSGCDPHGEPDAGSGSEQAGTFASSADAARAPTGEEAPAGERTGTFPFDDEI